MAVNSSEECQGAHSVPMLSDGGTKSPKCESDSLLEVPGLMNSQICLDALSKCQNDTSIKVDIMDIYASPILGTDIEKGKLEIPKSNGEAVGNMKTEDCLSYFQRSMQREINLHVGGKFMQLLMNSSLELPKFTSRDKCMTPTSRSRKYKRSVSFNSRRVVFLFSILIHAEPLWEEIMKIMETLVHIQYGDNYTYISDSEGETHRRCCF